MNTSGNSVQESAANGNYSRTLQGLWGMLLCLVLGLGLTAFMYQYFVHIDLDRIEEHLLRGTQVLASTEASAEIDQDVQATFPALDALASKISDSGRVDAALLESVEWRSPNPLTEGIGLRYLPRVRFNAEANRHEMMDPTGR